MEKTNEKKAKAEKKFNSEKVGRLAKSSLKSVFPNEAFIVSTFVDKVEALYPANSKITASEINTFKLVFCDLSKTKKEQLVFSQYEKKAV